MFEHERKAAESFRDIIESNVDNPEWYKGVCDALTKTIEDRKGLPDLVDTSKPKCIFYQALCAGWSAQQVLDEVEDFVRVTF